MSHISRMTMIGLYNYDSALFDKLTLPDGISKPDFINSFLLKYGECPVIYPNWEFMQFALGAWGVKWYDSIQRIITAFTEEYNPLHNFDRHEEYSDVENNARISESVMNRENRSETDSTENGTHETNAENEDTVSAYNEQDYQPDRKNTSTEKGTAENTRNDVVDQTGKDSLNATENTDRNLTHEGHLYGNIGVTESTTMLMHEKELRENYNVIDIVCDMLYKEVCIYIY